VEVVPETPHVVLGDIIRRMNARELLVEKEAAECREIGVFLGYTHATHKHAPNIKRTSLQCTTHLYRQIVQGISSAIHT
jgi:hypothetical protein